MFSDRKALQIGLPDTSHPMPAGVMANLDIPGYSWLYLTVTDGTNQGRNFTFTAGGIASTRPSGGRSEGQANQQAGGDRGRHRQTESPRSAASEERFRANTAREVPFKLPRILMTNARSLPKKMEDLRNRIRTDEEIQKCKIMCFTETWLTEPSCDEIEGYRQEHRPRDPNLTGKKNGGGLGVLIKNGVRAHVIGEKQTPNYQRIVFIYKTENHPEGAPPLVFMLVYIQPQVRRRGTRMSIERHYSKALRRSNQGPVFILGDFNWCKLRNICDVTQYVTCPTRGIRILDKCYGNVPQAYTSQCRPPLRSTDNTQSDHNVILLTQGNKRCPNPQW